MYSCMYLLNCIFIDCLYYWSLLTMYYGFLRICSAIFGIKQLELKLEQPVVPPVMTKLASWQPSVFSDCWQYAVLSVIGLRNNGTRPLYNTLRPRQNGRHFADDIFECIFLNENVWILIKNSLKFVPKRPINNISTLVQIMAWRRSGDKPLSESMLVNLPTHICVTRPQWVNYLSTSVWNIYFWTQKHFWIICYISASEPTIHPHTYA